MSSAIFSVNLEESIRVSMTIGILHETKLPPDRRVPLTPQQIKGLQQKYADLHFVVQPSKIRAFSDEEYLNQNIRVEDDLSSCDLLMGVKEIDIKGILPGKPYLFFSHTAKEQPQNQKLLQNLSDKKCTLIDYEYLVKNNTRVVAFGSWAGIAGAYAALYGIGELNGKFHLKAIDEIEGFAQLLQEGRKIPPEQGLKIAITGEGRVAGGAAKVLTSAGIKRLTPGKFLNHGELENVFCHLGPQHYTKHYSGKEFEFKEFLQHPEDFEPNFSEYAHSANVLIACHYWDPRSPHFFTPIDLQNPEFSIRLISDVSCDIPGPIPTTLRTSTLAEPFYGVDRKNCEEIEPFNPDQLSVSAVDNLPSALPREASEDFGNGLIASVIPNFASHKESEIINGATILREGKLTRKFAYLRNYLESA